LLKVKQTLQRTNLGSLVCNGLGMRPAYLPLNQALQSSPQVTVTQLAVCDSGFVQ